MQLGFLFLGGAALVAASPLGLAIAQVRDVLLLGQDVFRVMRISLAVRLQLA